MKIKPIFLSLLLLAAGSSAHATFVTGDANTFHGEFDLSWPSGATTGSITDIWPGGSYNFRYSITVLQPYIPGPTEIYESLDLQTFWNDGSTLRLFTQFISTTLPPGPSDPVGRPSHNLPYISDLPGYNISSSQLMTLEREGSGAPGQGTVTFDIARVPDTGSTLLLLGLVVIGMVCPKCGYDFKARWTNITQKDFSQRGEVQFGEWERSGVGQTEEIETPGEQATPDERNT